MHSVEANVSTTTTITTNIIMTIALVIDQPKPKDNMAKTRTFIQWYPMRDGGCNNNCQLSRKRGKMAKRAKLR